MISGDLETTGLLRPGLSNMFLQPHITEYYFCKHDWEGNVTDEMSGFLKPPVPLSEEVIRITGITDEMLEGHPRFIEIYDDLYDFFKGEEIFIAHNCSYEIGVLSCELMRHDLDYRFCWPKTQICTVEKSFDIENKRLSLDKLYKIATGKTMTGHHRAKSDVMNMIECVVWLKKEGFLENL